MYDDREVGVYITGCLKATRYIASAVIVILFIIYLH